MATFHFLNACLTILAVALLSLAIPLKNETRNYQLIRRVSRRHDAHEVDEVSDAKFTPISPSPIAFVELISANFPTDALVGYEAGPTDSPESSTLVLPSFPSFASVEDERASVFSLSPTIETLVPSMTPSFRKSHSDEIFGMHGRYEPDPRVESDPTTIPTTKPDFGRTAMPTFEAFHAKVIVIPNTVISPMLNKSLDPFIVDKAQDSKYTVEEELNDPLVINVEDIDAKESIAVSPKTSPESSTTVLARASAHPPTGSVELSGKKMPELAVDASTAPNHVATQDSSAGTHISSSPLAYVEQSEKKMANLIAPASAAAVPETRSELSVETQISSSPVVYADLSAKNMSELNTEAFVNPMSLETKISPQVTYSELSGNARPELAAEASATPVSGEMMDTFLGMQISSSPAVNVELSRKKMPELTAELLTAPMPSSTPDSTLGTQVSSSPATYPGVHRKKMLELTAEASTVPVPGSKLDSTIRNKASESIEDDLLF